MVFRLGSFAIVQVVPVSGVQGGVLQLAGVTVKEMGVILISVDIVKLTGELVLVAKLKFGMLEYTDGLSGVMLSGMPVFWSFG